MVYLYEACDQISDSCHQQLLRKMWRKISWTDRGKTVYPPPPSGSGGIKTIFRTAFPHTTNGFLVCSMRIYATVKNISVVLCLSALLVEGAWVRHMKVAVNKRLHEYGHKQVKWREKRWNNKEIFIENKYVNHKLKNSWSQGRPSSSPVQSIVTCECHNHVVSV
jgi:hypothetical protein